MILNFFKKYALNRVKRGSNTILKQNQVYVFPTKNGFFFLFLCALLVMMAINFESAASLVYIVVFWLMGMWTVSILLTWKNLIGLQLTTDRSDDIFAGNVAQFNIVIEGKRQYFGIHVEAYLSETKAIADINTRERREVFLYVESILRGILPLPILKIETTYPLGLIRAWSYVHLEQQVLCYPNPIECELPQTMRSSNMTNDEDADINDSDLLGVDDFMGLQKYSQGDSLRHIDWRAYAKGRGVFIKQFGAESSNKLWLNYDDFSSDNKEIRLSKLCYLALKLNKEGAVFGLNLSGKIIEPSQGNDHLTACLRLLANF